MSGEINSFSVFLHALKLKLSELFSKESFISEDNIYSDPFRQFEFWYNKAINSRIPFYEAMNLSSATPDGKPSARMVLLKAYDHNGFIFYSNSDSRKGLEIQNNPNAALTFYWNKLGRQIRIEGRLEQISEELSDAYFASRPRGSQIGAWASHQSSVISNRNILVERVKELEKKYKGQPVPRPPYWIGYRLIPKSFEFWQNRISRLHDRFLFTNNENNKWSYERLSP